MVCGGDAGGAGAEKGKNLNSPLWGVFSTIQFKFARPWRKMAYDLAL